MTFANCEHLVGFVFGEHSNITYLGEHAFQECSALTKITLPNKLEVIETLAFVACTSLKRVVYNKNLKTIGEHAFQHCDKLENVQLASSSISFGDDPFAGCYRLIEIAAAAGFPSNNFEYNYDHGDGVAPYLID